MARSDLFGWRSIAAHCVLLVALPFAPAAAQDYPVRVDRNPVGKAVELMITNDGPAPINVVIELTSTKNTGFSPAVIGRKFPHFVMPYGRRTITTAVPLKLGKPAEFAYRFRYAFGDPQAVHDNDFVYRLPIPDGVRGVARPYSGYYVSNTQVDTANAVEIMLPHGTPVVAARSGVVIHVRPNDAPTVSGFPSAIGNFVKILHDDGTWAAYGWLADDSVRVVPGQKVAVGETIGLSGSNPDSFESYIVLVVLRNWFGLQLRSVPIRMRTAGDEIFDIASYTGQVSPNLKPLYGGTRSDEPPWFPSESILPSPKPPVIWDDEHLTPAQRQALFRQRLLDSPHSPGNDTVSGSRPLFFLAISGALLGTLGAVVAFSTHSTSRPAGIRGALWFVFRGRPPSGGAPPDVDAVAVDARGVPIPVEATVVGPLADPPPPDQAQPPAEPQATVEPEEAAIAPRPVLSADRCRLLAMINASLPGTVICTPSLPLSSLSEGEIAEPAASLVADFVLLDVDTGVPKACVIFAGDVGDSDRVGAIVQQLSLMGIPTITLSEVPRRGELKHRLKRLV